MPDKSVRGLLQIVLIVVLGVLAGSAAAYNTPRVGILPIALWCTALAFLLQWLVFIWAYLAQTEAFYDLTGSLTYIGVVLSAVVMSQSDSTRELVLALCISAWASRLGIFLFLRIRQTGGDRRFEKLKTRFLPFLMTWTLQGLWVIATACCALAAISSEVTRPLGAVGFVGIALWIAGFSLEVIADTQKSRFRAQPENTDSFIRTGVWAVCQHPNYLGEIVLWLGIALIALPVLQGWQYLTLLSPLFVTILLTRVSGIPLLQASARKRWGNDPVWQHYTRTTPLLLPGWGRDREN